MTLEIAILLALIGLMVALFLTEWLPIDLTAFAGLAVLVLAGYLAPGEAFQGFASPAVITMLSIFVVGGALLETGVADVAGGWIHQLVGDRETATIVLIMALAGILSGFMNNIAATAVLMPAVASVARRSGIPGGRLFMPLSFGAILGGTTTVVGTPPNILGSTLLAERGLEPFALFDFTPVGAALLVTGILYMTTIGKRLIPVREGATGDRAARELARIYELKDNVLSLRVPEGSALAGRTLDEAGVASILGVQVVAIERDEGRTLAPSPDTVVEAGDVISVEGRIEDLEEMKRMREVEIETVDPTDLPRPVRGVGGMRATVKPGSPLVDRTLEESRFRRSHGLVVVAIRRDGEILRDRLARKVFQEGDEVFVVGARERIEAFADRPDIDASVGLDALAPLWERLFLIRVPEESSLVGRTIEGSRLGELAGISIGGLVRGDRTRMPVSPEEILQPGDRLVVAGEPSRIVRLLEIGDLELRRTGSGDVLESEDVGVVEVTPSPRARIVGMTLSELSFRDRYGLQALSVWREGRPLHRDLAGLTLRVGDALLLQGPRHRIEALGADDDFVVLSPVARRPRRVHKAPWALGALGVMIALVVTGWQPIEVASFVAAVLVLLAGAMTMEEAYRTIEWRAIFLVAAVLPVGIALERSGAAALLAEGVAGVAGPLGERAVLAALVGLSSAFSQGLDGAPAVVLLDPIAYDAAATLGVEFRGLMMGISLAASAAFMTPFSHKANLLVMGAGGYRAMDYVKVGSPLTLFVLLLIVLLVPLFFPL